MVERADARDQARRLRGPRRVLRRRGRGCSVRCGRCVRCVRARAPVPVVERRRRARIPQRLQSCTRERLLCGGQVGLWVCEALHASGEWMRPFQYKAPRQSGDAEPRERYVLGGGPRRRACYMHAH
eukprot:6201598-Pleurochrysis_carterae.AAC.6